MRDATVWSVGLGRWLGVPVRLHVSFVLLAMAAMFVATRPPFDNVHDDMWLKGLLLLAIWLVSVVLHAAGHAVAVSKLGGCTEDVVLTPFGEVAEEGLPLEPQRELIVALSGPLANLAAGLACAALLYALGETTGIFGLLSPFYPRELAAGTLTSFVGVATVALKMALWVNWVLLLVNVLLPAFPLDGGRALRSALAIFPAIGPLRAAMVVVRITFFTALLLILFAAFLGTGPPRVAVPAWLPLLTLAMYLYFHACWEWEEPIDDDVAEELFGYDFSQGYTSLERKIDPPGPPSPGPIRRWLDRRRQQREARRQVVEREEEQRVDGILQRLHEQGPQSLSTDDRALLNRVSARYRSRPRSESS